MALPETSRLAPLVDRVRDHGEAELPAPRTLQVTCWEDGDFAVRVHHTGDEGRETGRYRRGEGRIVSRAVAGSEVRAERTLETVTEP